MSKSILGKRSRNPQQVPGQDPVTPTKRRVLQLGTPENTPSKGQTNTKKLSPYSPVKSVLRRSAAAQIVGRKFELERLREFGESTTDGLLYICGPPGTGKSATVNEYTTRMSKSDLKLKIININCVSLKSPHQVYEYILRELDAPGTKLAQVIDILERLDQQGEQVMLVLDEVDYLASGTSKVIYSLFELGHQRHLKIIAIANALNLTDTLLPHLRAAGLDPLVLRFKPYTPSEITEILTSRVAESAKCISIIDRPALDFIGRKVANATGDIRKALDILRRSVECVEMEYRTALSPLDSNSPSAKLAPVTIKHISKVASQALGNTTSTAITSLSIHEKAILCTLCVRKTDTINATFEAYSALCLRDRLLTPLARSEFGVVVSGLLDNAFLTHTKSKGRIALGVTEMEVLNSIAGIGILSRFYE